MKSSKPQIMAKFHKIPDVRFEDQRITSFSGLLIFQLFFKRIDLKQQLKNFFAYLKLSPTFGRHLVVPLLIVHLLIGFRRLREIDYYRDDPLVLRIMGMRKLTDVSTISCALGLMDAKGVENVRALSRNLVMQALIRENFLRLTFDFDGSIQSTKGHAQGTAVGFNKQKKGARVTARCFAPWPRPISFSIFSTGREMSMIPMVLLISRATALKRPKSI